MRAKTGPADFRPSADADPSLVRGFPPIASADARVLVLGTAPSVASLAKQQYYGHARNAFWPIMDRLFGAHLALPYAERRRILCNHRVAVWDVYRQCLREGSLDSLIDLESETANDFLPFLQGHRQIRAVFFNGCKAESAFRRLVLPTLGELRGVLRFARLPSTSPAHAGRNFEQKLAAWHAVKQACGG